MTPKQKTKQSLLNLGTFMKNPKQITVMKHKYLAVGLEMPTKKRKPYVDKDKQKRLKEEKMIEDGCEGWRHFMTARGIRSNDDSHAMLFAYGPPPDPYTLYDDDSLHDDPITRHRREAGSSDEDELDGSDEDEGELSGSQEEEEEEGESSISADDEEDAMPLSHLFKNAKSTK